MQIRKLTTKGTIPVVHCNSSVVLKTKTLKTKTQRPKTYEDEDLQKQRPPKKTKTCYKNEDPFIFCRKRNNFYITLLSQN